MTTGDEVINKPPGGRSVPDTCDEVIARIEIVYAQEYIWIKQELQEPATEVREVEFHLMDEGSWGLRFGEAVGAIRALEETFRDIGFMSPADCEADVARQRGELLGVFKAAYPEGLTDEEAGLVLAKHRGADPEVTA